MEQKKIFNADVMFAFFLGGIIVILLFPLPTFILDLLLVCNIAIAIFILIIMLYLNSPTEFSSFPSLLLIITLFRLSLNVASTKLILLNGKAGHIIDAFGRFVIGNNYIVGAVIFIILVVIQFMVITKGAGRIAEVSARFTLDAMPGKQMSIDADLNAGIIDENEARNKRQELSNEAEFYGSMDGASKFVKGDAMAGLVITAINIVGGFGIGVIQQKMQAATALQTYTTLTIGDGLVSQIPALIISIAAGILVTKAADSKGLGIHIASQLFRRADPLYISSVMLFIVAVLPGLPFLPFFILSIVCLLAAKQVSKLIKTKQELVLAGDANALGNNTTGALNKKNEDEIEKKPALPIVNPMTIEIGFGLVPLVDKNLNGDLVDRISMIREQIKEELGFLIPPISIQDNLELPNNCYRVLVRGLERTRGTVQVGSHLAINPGDVSGNIEGIKTQDPTFGFQAVWINPRRIDTAESRGYTVVDCSSVIATHVTKIVTENAAELLSRQSVSDMMELIKKSDAAVVEELIPNLMSIGIVHRVLQYLLAEQVPIHDLPVILETLADQAPQTNDPLLLCEFCRQALKGHIIGQYQDNNGRLYALILQPTLEEEIHQHCLSGTASQGVSLNPARTEQIINQIQNNFNTATEQLETPPVLLVAPGIRPHISRLVTRTIPDLAILSYAELSDEINLQIISTINCKPQIKEPIAS